MTAEQIALENEILRVQVGSGVHGTAIPGTDDDDEMGICIEPAEYVIGLKKFEQWVYRTQPEGVRSGPGDLDLTVYSLRKWMRLAVQGNPTVLLPLFTPRESIRGFTLAGMRLMGQAPIIVSQQAGIRFHGYMQSQRQQLLGLQGRKHTNRPELVEKYGFDTKFAMHMIRLGVQGVELLTTGRITLPIPEPDRSWLVELRHGQHTKAEAVERADELEAELIHLMAGASPLPDYPNYRQVSELLIDMHRAHWDAT